MNSNWTGTFNAAINRSINQSLNQSQVSIHTVDFCEFQKGLDKIIHRQKAMF